MCGNGLENFLVRAQFTEKSHTKGNAAFTDCLRHSKTVVWESDSKLWECINEVRDQEFGPLFHSNATSEEARGARAPLLRTTEILSNHLKQSRVAPSLMKLWTYLVKDHRGTVAGSSFPWKVNCFAAIGLAKTQRAKCWDCLQMAHGF